MSSSAVETVRTIPSIVEKDNSRNHIPVEIETSGFPFERESDRDGHFRSQLDDIAKRHPEFAEHLGNFSRRRQSSGGDTEDFHRRFERPFAGHFERFGFPFDRDNFDPEQYAQQFYQQQPEYQHPQPQSYQHQYSYQPQSQEYQQQCPSQKNVEDACDTGNSNIQQSSTTDLGQKQEPVNERNQRSMSAPPAEKAQRFTSSINIPVNQPQQNEGENMAQTQSQQSDGKTTERIIPIHIEGRDEPVLPKTAPPTFSQPHQTYAGPQPERIFGQRPEHFTQFVNREPRQFDKWNRPGFEQMHQGFVPEEIPRQQRYPQQNVPPFYQQQQQQRPAPQQHAPPQTQPGDDIPIHVQREAPQTKQQAPPQQQAAPPQQPPQPKPAPQQQKPRTQIDQIQDIQKDVSELLAQVEQFSGKPKDKQYLYLDEMLTRNLLKLDNIDTQGQESIRSARKEAIRCIEKAISVLEAKAAGNVEGSKADEKMEVEEKSQEAVEGENKQTEVQTMETEPTTENKAENELQPMEFSPESTTKQEQVPCEEKGEEKPATEEPQPVDPVVENRAVLVTTANKEELKVEDKVEPMETKEEPPAVSVEEPKQEVQESNLPVAEAVKKFEGKEEEKEESKPEENKEVGQVQQEENKVEGKPEENPVEDKKEQKVEEKKEKKKGKKKVEKKDK